MNLIGFELGPTHVTFVSPAAVLLNIYLSQR